jgi:minor extracellular serine protease Vpr
MRHLIFIFCLLYIKTIEAQPKIPASSRALFHELEASRTLDISELQHKFPLIKIHNEYKLSCVAKINHLYDAEALKIQGISTGSRIGKIVTVRVPLNKLDIIKNFPGIDYLEIAARVSPELERAVKDIRVDSVHNGFNLPQPFTGKNVIIGITDWGFDYTHPMFYDTAMNETRILAAWDQYKSSGPAPAGYDYGTEFSTKSDIIAAQSDTFNIYEYSTHGTHVAGIAGGGGAGTPLRGVAYEAEFLFNTFLVDLAAVLDAFNWMKQKADNAGKRLVINMSWGLYHFGTLDGTSLLSKAMEELSQQGVVFVTSGGNNGNVNFHIKKDFNNDTLKTRIAFYSYSAHAKMWGQSISMWGQPGNPFEAGLLIMNSQNQIIAETPLYHTASLDYYLDTIHTIGTDTIFYNLSADAAHPLNQRPHMRLRVQNKKTSYRVCLKSFAASGTVHYWNVTELTNDVGNWGMPFEALTAEFTAGDNRYAIGEPACAEAAISVAAHEAEYNTTSGALLGGSIAGFSSFGPTYDGRIKPDISAPGVSVASSISSFTNSNVNAAFSVNFNGRDYPFARLSGTSMSSPAVAGVVALLLEAKPDISAEEIKSVLKETARIDARTGNLSPNGDTRWGWGKTDAYQAIIKVLGVSSVASISKNQLTIFPNPASESIYFQGMENTVNISIYSTDGKLVKNEIVQDNRIDISMLPQGLYILEANSTNQTYRTKLVKR